METEILLSCMHQKDFGLVDKSNIKTSVLIINQCNENKVIDNSANTRMICTTERGLSKSRNMAVRNATKDICLLADDDEVFVDEVSKKISDAYENYKNADVIVFKMVNYPTRLGESSRKLKQLDALKVCSWEISFKLDSIKKNKIFFDEKLGAGTGNGGGEENKFILDCIRKGLNVYYVPIEIATVAQQQSTWFDGYSEDYFYTRGKATGYILGKFAATLYAFHFSLTKRDRYVNNVSTIRALKNLLKGIGEGL